jgi:DNA-binding transcriptional LysR family regulator
MDRLRAIEIFTEVAKSKSFTAAAERLGVSKGNVTKHIQWLEETFGAQLLTRTTKTVSLTEAGQNLLNGSEDLLNNYGNLESNVRGEVSSPKGLIRVGAPPSFGASHLIPLITTFSNMYPDIAFAMHLDDGRLDLASESLDLSLRITPTLKNSSLVALKLGSVPQRLVASDAYLKKRGVPKSLNDLTEHDCLINSLKSPTSHWSFTGPEGKKTIRVTGSMRANFGEPLRHAALHGQGISMHPEYMIADDLREKRLRVVLPKFRPIGLDIYAVYSSRLNTPGRVRLFLDFLQNRF